MHWNMAHGVSCVSSVTHHVMQMTSLERMQDRHGAAIMAAQDRDFHSSTEVAERYASSANC